MQRAFMVIHAKVQDAVFKTALNREAQGKNYPIEPWKTSSSALADQTIPCKPFQKWQPPAS